MITIVFDIMLKGRFVMQIKYKHCMAFKLDERDVLEAVFAKRPSLRGKEIKMFITNNEV